MMVLEIECNTICFSFWLECINFIEIVFILLEVEDHQLDHFDRLTLLLLLPQPGQFLKNLG